MELMTSYERKGFEIGKQEGIKLGKQEGIKEGERKATRKFVLQLLRRQLGSIPLDTRRQVETLSVKQLEKLSDALFDFSSKDDLSAWLKKNSSD